MEVTSEVISFTAVDFINSSYTRNLGTFGGGPFKLQFEVLQKSGTTGGEGTMRISIGSDDNQVSAFFDAGTGPFLPATSALVAGSGATGDGTPTFPFTTGDTWYLISLEYDGTDLVISVDGVPTTDPLEPGYPLTEFVKVFVNLNTQHVGSCRWQLRNMTISPL